MAAEARCLELIKKLSDAFGPSGFEDEAVAVAREYAADLGTLEEDKLRNLYIYRDGNTGDKPVFMLDAHSDEVGFMVHSIRPNGMLRLVTLGGWSLNSLSSNRILVRNAEGKYVPGIIAQKPVHFMSEAEKSKGGAQEISAFSVDIGSVSYEQTVKEFKIRIGEPCVPDVKCSYDGEHDVIFGKGFDCRIGCAVLLETMRRLKGESLNVDVVGVLSSQEEVGERGCTAAVQKVKPDVALAFEGCPADDTFTEPYAIQTALKKGPMLRFLDKSVICSPRLQRYALDLAEEKGLMVQASVREGGGNNGAVIQKVAGAVPVIVAGVPVRYIHSQNCITSYTDFEASVEFALALVRSMSASVIDTF